LNFEGKKFVLHSVPAGVFRKNTINIVGNGVVLDPIFSEKNVKELKLWEYLLPREL